MEKKNNSEEKRKFKRVSIQGLKVSYKLLDPRTLSAYQERILEPIQNISLGGVCFNTTNELTPKAPVGLDLKINNIQEPIRTFGRVAWIKKEENDYHLGISFSWWMQEEDKKTLFDLIQKHTA